jgi:hypothetical protein
MTTTLKALLPIGGKGAPLTKFEIGAKALHLHQAAQWGFNVPKGFVVPAALFTESGPVAASLAQEILVAAAALGEGPYAVRSSATLEDGAETSFAGQFVTVLGVESQDLIAAVETCRQSIDAIQVQAYASQGGGSMAILIQQMVPAEIAGVAFSANPISGERSEVVIEAVVGLGDKLVSGEVIPEQITWKSTAIHRNGPKIQTLTEAMISKIAEVAKSLESKFGCPQDIEWAFSKGEFFLLQSRPITALPIAPIPIKIEIPKGSWKRDDHHTVPTPFTWDLFFGNYAAAFTEVLKTYSLPVKSMQFKVIGGHLYSRMEMAGGGGSKNPPDWVMWLVTRLIPAMRKMNKHAGPFFESKAYRRPILEWESSDEQYFKQELAVMHPKTLHELSNAALIDQMARLREVAIRGAWVHAGLGMASFSCIGVFAIFCKTHLGWEYPKSLAVLSGNSTASTQHLLDLEGICKQHFSPNALQQLPLERKSTAEILADNPKFKDAVAAWIDVHGMRMSDYDVNNLTWGENIQFLHQTIHHQLQMLKAGKSMESRLQKEDSAEIEVARKHFRDKGMLAEFEDLLEWGRKGYFIRDANGIECISKVWGLLRLHLLEMGKRIADLPNGPEDMVMLTQTEADQALKGELPQLKETILHRLGEMQWAKFNRGPVSYGPPEAPMPNLKPFPDGLKKLFGLFEFMEAIEPSVQEKSKPDLPNRIARRGCIRWEIHGHCENRGRAASVFQGPSR